MNILIAFPDPVLSTILRTKLESQTCTFVITDNEDEFVNICQNEKFDTIVTSFFEPFLNGQDLATTIRSNSHSRRTSIFIVCPSHNEQTLISLYESGVDQYLTTPLNIERITRKIMSRV